MKMKKLFIPIAILLATGSLVGCKGTNVVPDYSDLKIACPSGAPALALYDMHDASNVEIVGSATNIASFLSENSDKDIVFAPTNLVVSDAMKNGAPYKLAAVVTAGNFFLAATGSDDNDTLDKDDKIVLFQKNGLPDRLFKYVYGSDFTNLEYIDAANNAAARLIAGDADYVLVPQPALTPALAKAQQARPNAKVKCNIQEDYYAKTGDSNITQASIFVRNTAGKDKVNQFLKDTVYKVNNLLENSDNLDSLSSLEDTVLSSKFGAPNLAILKKVVKENSINLCYKEGTKEKGAIDKFLKNLGFTNEDTNKNLYWE